MCVFVSRLAAMAELRYWKIEHMTCLDGDLSVFTHRFIVCLLASLLCSFVCVTNCNCTMNALGNDFSTYIY